MSVVSHQYPAILMSSRAGQAPPLQRAACPDFGRITTELHSGKNWMWLSRSGPLYVAGQADCFQGANQVPPDVRLPPSQPQTRRAGVGVMVAVPVFAPGCQLQWAQPPDVPAGVSLFGVSEVGETVHETLHMQRIDQTDGPHPEEALPAEHQTAEQREENHRRFHKGPELVASLTQLRTPPSLIGRRRL